MNWNEYYEMPDEGLFEKIEKRLRRRRLLRAGAVVAGALVVAGAVLWALVSGGQTGNAATEPQARLEMPATLADRQPVAAPAEEWVEARDAKESVMPTVVEPVESVAAAERGESVAVGPAATAPVNAPAMVERTAPVVTAPVAAPAVAYRPVAERAAEQPALSGGEAPMVGAGLPSDSGSVDGNGSKVPVVTPPDDLFVWAPNVIAPKGEVDDNRIFRVVFSAQVSDFHLYIYSRSGRLVYSSTDVNSVWDGTFHGSQLPQGGYVWVVNYRDSERRPHQHNGTVTVVY